MVQLLKMGGDKIDQNVPGRWSALDDTKSIFLFYSIILLN